MLQPSLCADRRGRGPALVLLHPLGGNRRVWEPVTELLAAVRETIAIDLPGFGGSPVLRDGQEPTPVALAHAIDTELQRLGIERYDVAGNSLGGWVALELALAGRARSVVALAPAGLWSRPLAPKPGRARVLARAALPLLAASPALRRRALGSVALHPARIPAAASRNLVHAYVTAPGFAATNAAMRANVFTSLDSIAVPVTLAWAEHDRLVRPPRHVPAAVRSVVLEGCGHLPMWDDPQQVADVLLAGSANADDSLPLVAG